jgi:hypothetical protein
MRILSRYLRVPVLSGLLLFSWSAAAQGTQAVNQPSWQLDGRFSRAEVVNGDTVPVVDLGAVTIYGVYQFRTRKLQEQWTRTKYNVKKVYPYAILAAAKLREYDLALAKIQGESQRKAFIKACEKDLRTEFEEEITNLTVSQGKILMKLIDRESGKTAYQVVRQLRGAFQAAMWQTVATIFGHNLKSEYDAEMEDVMIERAVRLVESGQF